MYVSGLVLTLFILALGMGDLTHFADAPSLIVVAGFTLGALLFSGARIPAMCRAPFSASASASELRAAARGWAQARTYVLAAGYIGTVIGTVLILKNTDFANPDHLSILGHALALDILTVFYALVAAYGVFLPLQRGAERRLESLGSTPSPIERS